MINSYKKDFPIFTQNSKLVYLDSASTTQKPNQVIEAITSHYQHTNANIHRGIYKLSEESTNHYESVRKKVAKFINAHQDEIILTHGTTIGLNSLAFGLRNLVGEGDAILISEMEHHSNIVPWQRLANENGAKLYFLSIDNNGMLSEKVKDQNNIVIFKSVEEIPRLKVLSLSHVSNVLGTKNDLQNVFSKARGANSEVITIIDAAQSVPHMRVDVKDLNCDFLVFSSHKILGPTGIGVLFGKKGKLEVLDPFIVGSQMISEVTKEKSTWAAIPSRFEPGTMPIEGVIGLGAAIDYLEAIGIESIYNHELELIPTILEGLKSIKGLEILGPKEIKNRLGVFSFTLKGIHPHDVAQILSDEGVCVRSGHHCTMPLHNQLGITASTRASFYLYNDKNDVEKLIQSLYKVKKIFNI